MRTACCTYSYNTSYRDIIYYHCTGIKSPASAFLQAHSSLQENKGFFSCVFLLWNHKRTDQQSQIVHWRTFGPKLRSSCPLNMLVPLLLITCNLNWKYNTIVLYRNACQHHWNVPGKTWSKSNSGKSPMFPCYFPLLEDHWSQQKCNFTCARPSVAVRQAAGRYTTHDLPNTEDRPVFLLCVSAASQDLIRKYRE